MAKEVPIKATPVDFESEAYRDTFVRAFRAIFHRDPWREEAEWLTALLYLENAGGSAVIQNNWGNKTPSKGEDYWVPAWARTDADPMIMGSSDRALRERFLAGEQVPGKFAAFATADEGAMGFFRLFKSVTNSRILVAAQNDSADQFVSAVATPHPQTKMMYCVECDTPAHRRSYERLKNQVHKSGLFDVLKKKNVPPRPLV